MRGAAGNVTHARPLYDRGQQVKPPQMLGRALNRLGGQQDQMLSCETEKSCERVLSRSIMTRGTTVHSCGHSTDLYKTSLHLLLSRSWTSLISCPARASRQRAPPQIPLLSLLPLRPPRASVAPDTTARVATSALQGDSGILPSESSIT